MRGCHSCDDKFFMRCVRRVPRYVAYMFHQCERFQQCASKIAPLAPYLPQPPSVPTDPPLSNPTSHTLSRPPKMIQLLRSQVQPTGGYVTYLDCTPTQPQPGSAHRGPLQATGIPTRTQTINTLLDTDAPDGETNNTRSEPTIHLCKQLNPTLITVIHRERTPNHVHPRLVQF